MKLLYRRFPLLLFTALLGFFSCTEEPLFVSEDRVVVSQVSEDYNVSISRDSSSLKRESKDASAIQATIQYQAMTYEEIDSVKWIFPGGTPSVVNDTLRPNVEYTGYGEYPAQLILTKYDTVNENNIIIRRDTIVTDPAVRIYFEENAWEQSEWSATPDTLTTHTWTSFPFSNLLVINEVNANTESIPYRRSANFNGFNGQQIRISFDYKITRKGGNRRFTGNNPKFDILVDGFKRLQVSKTPNDEYQIASILLNNASDFAIEIVKYPGLNASPWQLSPTSLPASCQTATSAVVSGTGSSSPSTSSISISATSLLLYQESTVSDQVFGFTAVASDTQYYFLNYSNNGQSFMFGTTDQNALSLNEPCPIEIEKGNYSIRVYLDEGFPSSFKLFKLDSAANFTSTIVDPNYFDLFIKNFKIDPY